MMNMTFRFSNQIAHFLFYPWEIKSWPDMLLALFVVLFTAVILELLILLRVKLGQKRQQNPLASITQESRPTAINNHHNTEQTPLLNSLRIPSSVSKIRKRRLNFHIVESVVHLLHVCIGYILMLMVMTYNAYIFILVVFTLSAGYFFLGPLRRMRAPFKVPAHHQSLTDSEHMSQGANGSQPPLVESAESSQNPYYNGLYM